MDANDSSSPEVPASSGHSLEQLAGRFHEMAASLVRRSRVEHTVATTDLVNEAVLRLLARDAFSGADHVHSLRLFAVEYRHTLLEWLRKDGRRD